VTLSSNAPELRRGRGAHFLAIDLLLAEELVLVGETGGNSACKARSSRFEAEAIAVEVVASAMA